VEKSPFISVIRGGECSKERRDSERRGEGVEKALTPEELLSSRPRGALRTRALVSRKREIERASKNRRTMRNSTVSVGRKGGPSTGSEEKAEITKIRILTKQRSMKIWRKEKKNQKKGL